jgi:hypothetical protein
MEKFMSLSNAYEAIPEVVNANAASYLVNEVRSSAGELAKSIQELLGSNLGSELKDTDFHELMDALLQFYGYQFDQGAPTTMLGPNGVATATAVLVAASGLLKSRNLEIFELGMWQSWSGTR